MTTTNGRIVDELDARINEMVLELEGNGMDNKGLRRYYEEALWLAGVWSREAKDLRAKLTEAESKLKSIRDHDPDGQIVSLQEMLTEVEEERDNLLEEVSALETEKNQISNHHKQYHPGPCLSWEEKGDWGDS